MRTSADYSSPHLLINHFPNILLSAKSYHLCRASLDEKHKHTTHSSYYLQHNHSKLSVALDMKKPAARQLVMSMVPKVDVVVENFAPGVMKRMGFAYEDLKRINPKIIMCSISMAGQTGPLSTRAGYDCIGQAYAGVTDGMGEKDRAPSMTTMAIGDVSTGVASA